MPANNEQVAKGVDFSSVFTVYSAASDPIAPDSAPTISLIHKNGVVTTISGAAITQLQDAVPANIVGYYKIVVPTSTLAVNDQIDIRITATISGKVRYTNRSFSVVDSTGSLPYID